MPTYVYRREDGTTFEIEQRITEDALETCPETGQKVERVISGNAGLIFKGSGFYLTDYARAKKSNGDSTSKSSDSSESSSSSEAPANASSSSEATKTSSSESTSKD